MEGKGRREGEKKENKTDRKCEIKQRNRDIAWIGDREGGGVRWNVKNRENLKYDFMKFIL